MQEIGSDFEESGLVIRDGGGFALKTDDGRYWRLDLHRVPVDHIEKRVRLSGRLIAPGLVEVDGIRDAN